MKPESETETNVKQAVPFFVVSNIEASVHYYVNGIGFEMTKKWIETVTFQHPTRTAESRRRIRKSFESKTENCIVRGIMPRITSVSVLLSFFLLVGCGGDPPPPPDLTCTPTGIAITNRSKEGPLTDVRLSVNNNQFLYKDPLPPIEAGHTLKVRASDFVDMSTSRPLALPGERLDCSAVTRIDASFKFNGKELSVGGGTSGK